MVISFEANRVFVDIHGGFATVEAHKGDRWARIRGPFKEVRGEILEEALEGVSYTITASSKAVVVKATADDGGELTIEFGFPPEISGGWGEE